jgi:surface protein
MFSDCLSLEELFFSNFNTENVKNMYSMFRKCDLLKEINLFKFNTENA